MNPRILQKYKKIDEISKVMKIKNKTKEKKVNFLKRNNNSINNFKFTLNSKKDILKQENNYIYNKIDILVNSLDEEKKESILDDNFIKKKKELKNIMEKINLWNKEILNKDNIIFKLKFKLNKYKVKSKKCVCLNKKHSSIKKKKHIKNNNSINNNIQNKSILNITKKNDLKYKIKLKFNKL